MTNTNRSVLLGAAGVALSVVFAILGLVWPLAAAAVTLPFVVVLAAVLATDPEAPVAWSRRALVLAALIVSVVAAQVLSPALCVF